MWRKSSRRGHRLWGNGLTSRWSTMEPRVGSSSTGRRRDPLPACRSSAIADPNRIGAAGFATPDSRSYFRGTDRRSARLEPRPECDRDQRDTRCDARWCGEWTDRPTGHSRRALGLATDDATVNGNVGTLGTAAASAPQWVTSDAPILTRSQEATTVVDTAILLPLIGSDPDNAPLTARISSLPAHGQLFQFAAGAIGPEIAAVPATVTDAERRVVYQPHDRLRGRRRLPLQHVRWRSRIVLRRARCSMWFLSSHRPPTICGT